MRGRGNYVSDIMLPNQSEVAFLRSPVAHAELHGVDALIAPDMPAIVKMGTHPLVPFLANMQLQRLRKR